MEFISEMSLYYQQTAKQLFGNWLWFILEQDEISILDKKKFEWFWIWIEMKKKSIFTFDCQSQFKQPINWE